MKYPLFLLFVTAPLTNANDERSEESTLNERWKHCDTFIAPSSIEGAGWGVYAGRSFKENEVVEISPLFLTTEHVLPVIKNSALDDFVYGYPRYTDHEERNLASVIFGNAKMYNHNATPNVRLTNLGFEPTHDNPDSVRVLAWLATRDIETGEEMFNSYGYEDGGKEWFEQRRLEQRTSSQSVKTGHVFEQDSAKYCAKTYAGIGLPSWYDIEDSHHDDPMPFTMDTQRLHEDDNAVAISKEDVTSGTILEMAPALVVSKHHIENTLLAPLSIFWVDLNTEQQNIMKELYAKKEWIVQYQGPDTAWARINRFLRFQDVAIFPVAGNIGLVEKVNENSNCKLEISSSSSFLASGKVEDIEGAGILLTLIATSDIKAGESLRLDVPFSANDWELTLMFNEMRHTGQPIPDYLWERSGYDEVSLR